MTLETNFRNFRTLELETLETNFRDFETLENTLKSANQTNFNFGNQQFLQLKRTAMGIKMAPQYANIFMINFEENVLQNTHKKPLIYLRYIDDIFL